MKVLTKIFGLFMVFVFVLSMFFTQSILYAVFYNTVEEEFFLATANPETVKTVSTIMALFSSYFVVIPLALIVKKEIEKEGEKHEH